MLAELIAQLQDENKLGVLLAAHVASNGGGRISLVAQLLRVNPQTKGLGSVGQYTIHAYGVAEHKFSLGTFGIIRQLTEHPLLAHHNYPKTQVHFSGAPKDARALLADIYTAHAAYYGGWRNTQDDTSHGQPLADLLAAQEGILAETPLPFADAIIETLQKHGVAHESVQVTDEQASSLRQWQLLMLDESYVIAERFEAQAAGQA